MSDRLTHALLDAIQARCDAAPPSPWRYREAAYGDPANGPDYTVLEAQRADEWSVIARGDYDAWSGYGLIFATNARTDLPRLIAAVRAVLDRACMEQDDAEYAITYAAEINDDVMLASQRSRKQAWADAARAIATALGADHE